MPKQRITKDMVLDAGFRILRESGEEQVLVKTIAAKLSCSVQPIYSYCENMDTLRQELAQMSGAVMREYVVKRVSKDAYFESTGKAYLSFAKEEPHLFRNYFLRKRSNVSSLEDLYIAEASNNMAFTLSKTLGISENLAKELHLNMIVYNTGLSFMMISTGGNFSEQELHEKLESAYMAFLELAKKKEKNYECNRHL